MVIYYRLTLVELMHCFARLTSGSLPWLSLPYAVSEMTYTVSSGTLKSSIPYFTIEELEVEADIKPFKLGTLLTFCINCYMHTDQFILLRKRSSYHPQYNIHILKNNIHKPVIYSVCLIRAHKLYVTKPT